MVSADEILFNNLMGRWEVPFQYHKTLRIAIRGKMTASPDLSPWLLIDNREEVWRTVRMLWNIGGHQDASASQHGSPGAPRRLDEARQFYRGRKESVPFLLQKRRPETKYVVIPTLNMKRPDIPTKAIIRLREWDSNFVFWTLDLNTVRLIVKPMGGAPHGGCGYCYWSGPHGGFEGPIPFSDMQDKTTRGSQKPKIEYVECESGDEEQEVALTVGLRSGRTLHQASSPVDSTASASGEQEASKPVRRRPDWNMTPSTPNTSAPVNNKAMDARSRTAPAGRPKPSLGFTPPQSSSGRHPTPGGSQSPRSVSKKRRKLTYLTQN
ncbi:hypothetical protein OEA41_001490 [Lepraria neglecta]|uniref:Uncharacterized protein n=1 Tax=Lepraria neglecta TaxID=209136 RepID=A0AAD9Z9V1_9LECA|nr:hypothetical protein OEA41_001490 [Lepraria neglecta]